MKFVRIGFVVTTAAALMGSLWLGDLVRFNFFVPDDVQKMALWASLWVISLKLFGLWRFRQFQVLLRYFNTSDFTSLFWALFTTSLLVYGVSSQLGLAYAPPRSVVVADFSFSLLGMAVLRHTISHVFRRRAAAKHPSQHRRVRRAGIIGAGLVGSN